MGLFTETAFAAGYVGSVGHGCFGTLLRRPAWNGLPKQLKQSFDHIAILVAPITNTELLGR
jgi:hypothetical protein